MMTDELETLRAENARLRSILEENGIDPDYRPEEYKPTFGPPTEVEYRLQRMMEKSSASLVKHLIADNERFMADMAFMSGTEWADAGGKIGSTLRVRAPVNYIVRNSP